MIFYLLSFLAGVSELGCICWGYSQGFSIPLLILLGTGYQVGNMFPIPWILNRKKYIIVVLLGCIGYLFQISDRNDMRFVGMLITIISCSICLQVGRSLIKMNNNTTIKRIVRFSGFIVAGMGVKYFEIIILAIFIVSVIVIKKYMVSQKSKLTDEWNNICIAMFFHQMHYFVYVYGTFIYAMGKLGMTMANIFFVCTWIVYTIVAPILNRQEKKYYTRWFFCGHTFLAIILLLMSFFSYNIKIYIILWILAGIGGGTVFCITALWKRKENRNTENIIIAENLGHLCGSFLGAVIMLTSCDIKILTIVGACMAILAMLFIWKEIKQENGN